MFKVTGDKNIQKSIAFLYITHEKLKFEMKITISFIIAHKKGNTWYKSNKISENLYMENYKTLEKEIKDD